MTIRTKNAHEKSSNSSAYINVLWVTEDSNLEVTLGVQMLTLTKGPVEMKAGCNN